jgi:hypothetical protein
MAYVRKTRDTWEVQQYTGLLHAWECVTTEDTFKDARARAKEYRTNEPEYGVRIKKVRERIETA